MVERMERTMPTTAVRDAASSRRFQPGQAVVGRVERVEETETGERAALVRAGGQLVRARLEAPLAVGRLYLFEIHERQGTMYWKAIPLSEPALAPSGEEAVRRWQKAWKLPDAALPVLRQALKAGAAATKEEIAALTEAVKETGQPDAAEDVLAHLFRRRLPFSSAVFRALWAAKTGVPLAEGLGKLKAAMAALSAHPAALELIRAMEKFLSPPLSAYETAVRLLLLREEEAETARALLARLGLAPLPEDRRLALREAVQCRRFADIIRQLGLTDEEAFLERWTALDAAYQSGALPAAEAKLWAAARATRDPALSLFCWLRRAAVRLGLEDEAALVRVGTIEDLPSAPSLKRLLFRFLHESGGSEGAKRAAEAILDQLDGMAIAAGGDGPIEHVWISFPLPLGGRSSDFAVCWQGRRKQGGPLDADYNRIVCCLTLEELGEVIVDMRVQRRIVHISIFHDDPRLAVAAARMAPLVKERFQAHGYALSGIDVKTARSAPPPPSVFLFADSCSEVDCQA
ncbi:cytosolic protein [Geobacillus thermocatenulatus]|uniref:Cytosolic protein n=1 Tax=Geobacillus thermocatenulatus TaxID=33938 RepID=A0A226Q440_9BACL|nr:MULTISPECIES: flagellar hook-length control protein FliK [Geobacillus]ASS99957.1 cytosolic protein [Geobacillus thermocatenulatus]KLR72599.1 cytosolic protein [Geobacillus sp. T6]OXB86339.1 cytosolic protein [Geobacillus thermocatenulatus]